MLTISLVDFRYGIPNISLEKMISLGSLVLFLYIVISTVKICVEFVCLIVGCSLNCDKLILFVLIKY